MDQKYCSQKCKMLYFNDLKLHNSLIFQMYRDDVKPYGVNEECPVPINRSGAFIF
jgi:hypothetical protein